jgi:hypothetical protein
MQFEEHERAIYSPQIATERQYDPLAVDRKLVAASEGRIDQLLRAWQPVTKESGDISDEGQRTARLEYAAAEEQLALIARKAFDLPPFPECTDGIALEYLVDYLVWMEKKGQRGETPPT